jgi:predicted dithiol-disulfide oxidoreductase (DUF899 family)
VLERAATARSPIERLIVYKRQRGFANPPFVFDLSGEYTRTYVNADDADVPGFSVFTRRDGVVRHFYSGEMSGVMADPGQDQRGRPDLNPPMAGAKRAKCYTAFCICQTSTSARKRMALGVR